MHNRWKLKYFLLFSLTVILLVKKYLCSTCIFKNMQSINGFLSLCGVEIAAEFKYRCVKNKMLSVSSVLFRLVSSKYTSPMSQFSFQCDSDISWTACFQLYIYILFRSVHPKLCTDYTCTLQIPLGYYCSLAVTTGGNMF